MEAEVHTRGWQPGAVLLCSGTPMRESVRPLDGFFSATALTLAARGIEGLVRNDGHMRLIVGCTLHEEEVEAIRKGEELRTTVEAHIGNMPLQVDNPDEHDALELLAWMVAKGILDVRLAVPCDLKRQPIASNGIFHEKAGIVEDKAVIAWPGTAA